MYVAVVAGVVAVAVIAADPAHTPDGELKTVESMVHTHAGCNSAGNCWDPGWEIDADGVRMEVTEEQFKKLQIGYRVRVNDRGEITEVAK